MANVIIPYEAPPEEEARVVKHALLAGPVRALALLRRVPERMRKRGWPVEQDLVFVLCAALALRRMHVDGWTKMPHGDQARVVLRRPASADALGELWPADKPRLGPNEIVEALQLQDLLLPV